MSKHLRSDEQQPPYEKPLKNAKLETLTATSSTSNPDTVTRLKVFEKFFKTWSPSTIDGDTIKFICRGEKSGVYATISSPTVMYQINNLPEIEEFCKKAHHNIMFNSLSKCHSHIFVTGEVRTGKTTLAKEIIPFFFTRQTKFSKYTRRYVSFAEETKQPNEGSKDFALRIIADILNIEKVTLTNCVSPSGNTILEYLQKQPATMHYIILDEIQLCDHETLSILKKILKIPELTGLNILSIWTGSTQAEIFRKLKMIPSNGYSFNDSCFTFHIPQTSDKQNLKELGAYINFKSDRNIVDRNFIISIRDSLRNSNCGHIDQICREIALGKTFENAVGYLVSRIFSIFDRDFSNSNLIEKLTENEYFALLKTNVFSKDEVLQASTNVGIEDHSCFFESKLGETYQLRDSLLDVYIAIKYVFETGKLKPKSINWEAGSSYFR